MTCDKIIIEDLLLDCIVGVNPEERIHTQKVNLTITLWVDLRASGESDELSDTVNYKDLKNAVREFVENSEFLLIEKLATEVARLCLRYELVERVAVRLEKPGALRYARTVVVEIERRRADF